MKGAMNPEGLEDFPHVKEWLGYARAAALVTKRRGAALDDKDKLDMLIRENVLLQIAHLKTHPYVAVQLAAGETEIHGWVYDIRSGEVLAYDERANAFIPVADHYDTSVGVALHAHRHATAR
jgi:carbonic anhydrase